jgi:hypothetical protein
MPFARPIGRNSEAGVKAGRTYSVFNIEGNMSGQPSSFRDDAGFEWAMPQQRAQHPDDARVYPRFFMEAVADPEQTKVQGRPIHREVECVEIIIAGDKSSSVVKRVTDDHRNRWPQHYSQFRRGVEQCADGVPLEQWPVMTTARVRDLKALGILTVEHVAALDENAIKRLGMGARALVDQAKAYIAAAKDGAVTARLAAENAQLKAQLDAVAASNADLKGKLDTILAHIPNMPEGLRAAVQAAPPAPVFIPAVVTPPEPAKKTRAKKVVA